MNVFEDFLDYCADGGSEDNRDLVEDILDNMADFFASRDIVNNLPVEELKWIKENLRPSTQRDIWGRVITDVVSTDTNFEF